MITDTSPFRNYLSLILLFLPAILFICFILFFKEDLLLSHSNEILYFPFQFWLIGVFGVIATVGGILDWRFHRDPLKLKISKKEREAEAKALGLGGLPMFILMALATLSDQPQFFLIPIIIVLVYTTIAICYDEFVFHRVRCGKLETVYHRMLVIGNGLAWLAWFHFIYIK